MCTRRHDINDNDNDNDAMHNSNVSNVNTHMAPPCAFPINRIYLYNFVYKMTANYLIVNHRLALATIAGKCQMPNAIQLMPASQLSK